jgi:hypothetical protein
VLLGQVVNDLRVEGVGGLVADDLEDVLLHPLHPPLGDVGDGGEAPGLELRLDEALDLADPADLAEGDEGDGDARLAGPAGPADPVDVGLRALGDVVVEDVGDVRDVEAAGGDVGGDQDVGLAGAEALMTRSRWAWERSPWRVSAE